MWLTNNKMGQVLAEKEVIIEFFILRLKILLVFNAIFLVGEKRSAFPSQVKYLFPT